MIPRLLTALLTVTIGTALAADPVPVTVAPLSRLVVPDLRDAPATALGLHRATVSAELDATVKRLHVEVGDRVAAGAPLVGLDCRDFLARAEQGRAGLRVLDARIGFADYRLERAQSLARRDAVAEETLRERESLRDALLAEREVQRAALDQAELRVARCSVAAPFAGTVVGRHAQLGELAHPGTALVTVLDTERVEVRAELRRELLPGIRESKQVAFLVDGRRYPVELRTALPSVDPRSDTVELRLVFSADRAEAGTPGRLVWSVALNSLPPDLLERRGDALGVFVLDGDRVRFVALPGAQEGRPAVADLDAGAALVVDGRALLRDGDPVRVVE